jgi:two-component system, OmpR family, sensor histidine kinase TctE
VQQATRPMSELGEGLTRRSESDLSPLPLQDAPAELLPLLEATNQHMARLDHLLANQKRFVRDVSHQLRTPLAVLKAQVQSARRGDVPPDVALAEMAHTVDDATTLANQMLALAKAEQLRTTAAEESPLIDWVGVVRQVALDVSPLAVEHALDFGLELPDHPVVVRAHEWALRELVRNLLHNAIRFSPPGAELTVSLSVEAEADSGPDAWARLTVRDCGPGIAADFRPHLFQPFARGGQTDSQGTGLGLAICHGLVRALGGGVSLDNRTDASGHAVGLDAVVRLPIGRGAEHGQTQSH